MLSLKFAAILAISVFAVVAAARADDDTPGADWIPQDQVVKKLEAAGYTNVTGVHADDGHWEGNGVKAGQITEFDVDPHSGAITEEEVDKD